jgi:hypothetical protein
MKCIPLTTEEFNDWKQQEIVFAEVAPLGAMGGEGTLRFYGLKEGAPHAYLISIFEQEALFLDAAHWFTEHSDNHRDYIMACVKKKVEPKFILTPNPNSIFDCLYGGMGHNVFVRKGVEMVLKEGNIHLSSAGHAFAIQTSVEGTYDFLLESHFFN